MEELKAGYNFQLERLRAEAKRLQDRAEKLHAREYEVLPEAWGLLNRACGAVADVTMQLTLSPDLDKMTDAQLDEFLTGLDWRETDKDKLRKASHKSKTYNEIKIWIDITSANNEIFKFNNYILLNGVFIEEPLAVRLQSATSHLRKAVYLRSSIERGNEMPDTWTNIIEEMTAVLGLVAEVKSVIRGKMQDTKYVAGREGA